VTNDASDVSLAREFIPFAFEAEFNCMTADHRVHTADTAAPLRDREPSRYRPAGTPMEHPLVRRLLRRFNSSWAPQCRSRSAEEGLAAHRQHFGAAQQYDSPGLLRFCEARR
jgi:hypothetical protein